MGRNVGLAAEPGQWAPTGCRFGGTECTSWAQKSVKN